VNIRSAHTLPIRAFDRLDGFVHGPAFRRGASLLLIVIFLGSLGVVEIASRFGLELGAHPVNHFSAVEWTITVLLAIEIVQLVFALARSVADSLGKQLQVFSLILLRRTFEELRDFPEPIRLEDHAGTVLSMAADTGGALVIFGGLVIYHRLQRHMPITAGEGDRARFIAVKKLIALALLVSFVALALYDAGLVLLGRDTFDLFATFFTILIFTDILIVFVSLRYTSVFRVVFRNFGFAVVTVFIRLALAAPDFWTALLGVGAIAIAVALAWLYNLAATEEMTADATP
jgi:hypothetical protein